MTRHPGMFRRKEILKGMLRPSRAVNRPAATLPAGPEHFRDDNKRFRNFTAFNNTKRAVSLLPRKYAAMNNGDSARRRLLHALSAAERSAPLGKTGAFDARTRIQ
jgi:hypothetical protein